MHYNRPGIHYSSDYSTLYTHTHTHTHTYAHTYVVIITEMTTPHRLALLVDIRCP